MSYDLVVLGAGAGGLTAALFGALDGLRVLVIEKSSQIGGTTAYSSGSVWIPADAADETAAIAYLDALVGERADRALRLRYVEAARAVIAELAARTSVAFRVYPTAPDYRPELPGARAGGRSTEPLPFDGRLLGANFDCVRAPIPELTLFGGMMVTRAEVATLLRLPWSVRAIGLGTRLTLRYLRDRLRYRRGTRLVLGNALAARLYWEAVRHGVEVWFDARVTALDRDGERVTGVTLTRGNRLDTVQASRGVVLAGGGFPAGDALRRRFFPVPVADATPAYEGCTGETLQLATAAGAALGAPGGGNALWFPSSTARRADGTTAVYPHIVLDRAKPGLIAVNSAGRRFVDEAAPYHEFVRAMYASHASVPAIPAWLICDRAFLWRYGLGLVRPHALRVRRFVTSGYLREASSLAALATAIGVDAEGLFATVAEHNRAAIDGVDPAFGKGANIYDRANGDQRHRPNPCLGPIAQPPFYAVAVAPTPLGTSLGIRTDADARALRDDGSPIAGLYVCGNDMDAPFGGEYPGAGAQLGVALVFGALAAHHAARAV